MTTVITPDRLDSLITATEAASLAGVALSTIHTWAQRGIVTAQARDPKTNRPLFRFIDVARAEHSTRQKARRTCG